MAVTSRPAVGPIAQKASLSRYCWSCGVWLPTLTENRPRRSITQEELWSPVVMRVRKSESPSWVTQRLASGRVSRGLDYLDDFLSKGILQANMASLKFQMEACSSVRESLGVSGGALRATEQRTTLRRIESQWMRFNLEVSRYRKLKLRVKGSLGMSQLVTLIFSVKRDMP